MKKIEAAWERYFRFCSNFFGISLLKAIWSADSNFFGDCVNDEDDLEDSLFFLTENIAVQFQNEEAPVELPPKKKHKKRKLA